MRALALLALGLFLAACGGHKAERLAVEVLAQHDHDPNAYTQGLVWHDSQLYESTGLEGRSSLRQTTLDGEVIRIRQLAPDQFGEGLELVGDQLLQLTWKNGLLLRYDLATFEPVGTQRYEGEGWGLCYDGSVLWMTDGSATLTRRDPTTFAALGAVTVKLNGRAVKQLNELECVDGLVYANVWKSNDIMVIDPQTGVVSAVVDAAPLRALAGVTGLDAVLNGIAYDPESGHFLLTGKLWPTLFEVRFVRK